MKTFLFFSFAFVGGRWVLGIAHYRALHVLCVLVFLLCYDKTVTETEDLGEKGVCFSLELTVSSSLREDKAGTEAETKECSLLTCPATFLM